MKHTDLKQFLALQSALVAERERIQARLAEINRVLGGGPARAAVSSDRRKFSAATRAKMAAAQKARWAKRGWSHQIEGQTPVERGGPGGHHRRGEGALGKATGTEDANVRLRNLSSDEGRPTAVGASALEVDRTGGQRIACGAGETAPAMAA
jgi:hypothetical protein